MTLGTGKHKQCITVHNSLLSLACMKYYRDVSPRKVAGFTIQHFLMPFLLFTSILGGFEYNAFK